MSGIRKWVKYLSSSKRELPIPTNVSQRLPPELLPLIFESFDDEDVMERMQALRTISLVCRAWRQAGQPLLFHHIEPQSYQSLRLLHKTLKAYPYLALYVRALIPPPLSGITLPRHFGMRARLFHLRSFLSYRDYLRMIALFHSVSIRCPHVTRISIPWCSTRGELGAGDYRLDNFKLDQLQELTLTPCVFHSYLAHAKISEEVICLPRLLYLKVCDINLSGVALLDRMSFPILAKLVLDGVYGIISNFERIIVDLKHLNSLQVTRGHFYENEDIAATPHWPWIVDPLFSTMLVPTMQELCVDALPISGSTVQLRFFRGLRRLELRAYEASTFFELKSELLLLTHLSISYRSSTFGVFKLISALSTFVSEKEINAPNLVKISIRWRCLKLYDAVWLNKVLVFCFVQQCHRYGVATDIEIHVVDTVRELSIPVSYAKSSLDARSWIGHKYSLPHLLDRGPVLLQLYR